MSRLCRKEETVGHEESLAEISVRLLYVWTELRDNLTLLVGMRTGGTDNGDGAKKGDVVDLLRSNWKQRRGRL